MNIERYRRAERAHWDRFGPRPTERFIDLGSPAVRVRVQEVGSGDPILFVHGGPNAGSTWAPLLAGLGGRRAIVLDRPGCGLSAPVDYRSAPLPAIAAGVLASLIGRLGYGPIDIVASSMGGTWALWLAEAHPELIRRLVLFGAPALLPGQRYPWFIRLGASPAGRILTLLPTSTASARSTFSQIGHGKSVKRGRIDGTIDWYITLMRDTDTMANELPLFRAIGTWRGVRPELIVRDDLLRSIGFPTLVVWGADETFNTLDDARRLVGLIPNARLEIIEDGGHLPWLDDPETAARLVADFLRQPRSATAIGSVA